MKSINLPPEVLSTVDSLMFKFIWQRTHSNKRAFEKVKRDVMCKPIEEEGLGMISAKIQQKAYLIKWIAKLESNSCVTNYRSITKAIINELGYLKCVTEATQLSESTKKMTDLSNFWASAIKEWAAVNSKSQNQNPDTSLIGTLLEPLFNNQKMVYQGKTFYFTNWADKGITPHNRPINSA